MFHLRDTARIICRTTTRRVKLRTPSIGYSISRWTSGRYRTKFTQYGVELIDDGFINFLREEATAHSASLNGTPMRIFNDGQASSVEVYVRPLEARDSTGGSAVTYPVLSRPHPSKASGALSAIPIEKLHLEDLLPNGGFRFLIIKCDGANTNRAAVKMLMSE